MHPELILRSAPHALPTRMEPDHVKETPSQDFTFAAAGGDICDGPRGLDDHGQELLAERGQAERTNQNWWLAKQFEFGVRIRPSWATSAACDGSVRRWILPALSGWPKIPVMPARAQ
jgi:hypothetical protein